MLKNAIKNKKSKTIILRVTPDEFEKIQALASASCLTVSEYVRKSTMGQEITSKADYEAVDRMIVIGANMGRLGGLLKLLISNLSKGDIAGQAAIDLLEKLKADREDLVTVIKSVRKF